MDAAAVGLVLSAAGLHAGWNLLLHDTRDRFAAIAVSGLVTGLALSPFVLWRPPTMAWDSVLVSAVAHTVYGFALAGAYARGDLAATYAVGRGVAPLLITVGAWMVLAQEPTPVAVAGAASLALGLVLLAVRSGRAQMLHATGLALVVGVAIATYSVSDARAVMAGATPIAYLGVTIALQGLLCTALLRFDVARLRREVARGVAIAAGSAAAYVLVLSAFTLAPAGQVATLREVSVLLALLLGRQRPGRLGWAGATLVVVGAVLAAR